MIKKKITHFGYEAITKEEKGKKVNAVFNSVATNYDLMNNLMSLGLHHVWKKILIETTTLKPKSKILDIAAGTADISIEFLKKNKDFEIFHTDINLSMLKEGKKKLINQEQALKEIYRVLSPGGKVIILEFSKIWGPLKKAYDIFSFKIVPKLGKLFAKDEKSYKYLVESIRVHPDQNKLLALLKAQGFEKTSFMNLSAGIVAIHKGYKF